MQSFVNKTLSLPLPLKIFPGYTTWAVSNIIFFRVQIVPVNAGDLWRGGVHVCVWGGEGFGVWGSEVLERSIDLGWGYL